MQELSTPLLAGLLLTLAVASLLLAPRVQTSAGFFLGSDGQGHPPGVWTLAFSQVTTWIFARSLLNAGILGYFFGIAGALAYAAYYLSFLSGGWIVDRLRFHHGAASIQTFLTERFGGVGLHAFNLLVGVRLVSEVFANLLVVGIVFGATGSVGWSVAVLAVTAVTLFYSLRGGLHASLRTDVLQFVLLAALLGVLTVALLVDADFNFMATVGSSPELTSPGWVLLVVAFLQVLSYPMHDPVMMDRGFLAGRKPTRTSFLHAFWISSLLILAFGLLGVHAGLQRMGDEVLLDTLARLFGTSMMMVLALALVISAASTLDSTFSSAAKLVVRDLRPGGRDGTPRQGRFAMAGFALAGLALVFVGSDDLFAAVAVSGTAALFLTPVIVFSVALNRDTHPAALVVAALAALTAALLYFFESSGYVGWVGALTGVEHAYSKLLVLNVAALVVGFAAFWLGDRGVRSPIATLA